MNSIILQQSEKRDIYMVWLGDDNRDEMLEIVLSGDNSEANVCGLFLGRARYTFKNNVIVRHVGRNTKANVFARGVALDHSQIDFSGMLRVEHGAKGTSTYFACNLMILSDQASAHTFPGLEIEENDIAKGGHAATVGKLNEEQMFYLMSRGLGYEEARKLVIKGFFAPVLEKLEGKDFQVISEKIEEMI